MNTRLKYQTCNLHDEPLNYICLHAKCIDDRIICAICKEQRHPQSHLTMPLKIYLSHKTQQLKCLTNTKLDSIQQTIVGQKIAICNLISEMKKQINVKLETLERDCNNFLNDKVNKIRECSDVINCAQFDISDMETVEETLRIVSSYQEFKQQIEQQIISAKENVLNLLTGIKFEENIEKSKWDGHNQLSFIQNIVTSNSEGYKVAYVVKPITKTFNKATFRIISASKNWLAIGVCHKNVIKKRKFGFLYHTIGHGIYGISCQGGMWSHNESQFNNRFGGIKFVENQTIVVTYDYNEHKTIFENEEGSKFSMKVNEKMPGNLHFCVILYHPNDQVQIIPQLSISH